MLRRNTRVRRGGFTLMELLLVMVILAVLAGIAVPIYRNQAAKSKIDAAKVDINNIESALEAFNANVGRFPSTDEGLGALMAAPPNTEGKWVGPYLKKFPQDPWGNNYIYTYPGQHNPSGCDLYSWGPDGQDGGGDDITNWTQQ